MTKKEKRIFFMFLKVLLDRCLWRLLMDADSIKSYNDEVYNLLRLIEELEKEDVR